MKGKPKKKRLPHLRQPLLKTLKYYRLMVTVPALGLVLFPKSTM
jgi:hypothetical protein